MEKEYDMEALFLYKAGWQYCIGKIDKVNDKTLRLEGGTKIRKEDYDSLYRLSPQEVKIYQHQLVKKMASVNRQVEDMLNNINQIKIGLKCSEFLCINSEKLQNQLDKLTVELITELPKEFKVNDKVFEVNYVQGLSEVNDND